MTALGVGEEGRERPLVGDVEGVRAGERAETGGGGGGRVGVQVAERDVRARLDERAGGRGPDTPARAGDRDQRAAHVDGRVAAHAGTSMSSATVTVKSAGSNRLTVRTSLPVDHGQLKLLRPLASM